MSLATPVRARLPRTRALVTAFAMPALALVLAACGGGDSTAPPVPSQLTKTAGDGVSATVATVTAASPTLKVTDENGRAVRGVVVNFAVNGGGSIMASVDTSDASGVATAGSWTLGTAAGQQTVTATSPQVAGVTATFTATAEPGAAMKLAYITQPPVSVQAGAPFTGPVIEIQDQFGNRTHSTATVSLMLAGDGGTAVLQGTTAVAAVDGRATFGQLSTSTMGTLTLVASAPGVMPVLSNGIAVAPGAPTALAKVSGDVQLGGAGAPAFLPPTVKVTDSFGNGVGGTTVTFSVVSGGGSVSGATVTSGPDGVARVGQWMLGATGTNVVRATAGTLTADFTATAAEPAPYQITLRYINTPTRRQQEAFERAWLRWRQIVRSDLPNSDFASAPLTNPCGGGGILPTGLVLNELVDDLIIYVNLRNIDGAGQVLGSAGPCRVPVVNNQLGLPTVGVMTFDTTDLPGLERDGQLDQVILHEMGHVLGIGSLWTEYGVANGEGTDSSSFTGAAARSVWQSLGGAAGTRVPVENCVGYTSQQCGAGTRDGHWRERTFNNELMTGFLNGGVANPLSALTIASLQDIGYTVDMSIAEPYALPTAAATSGTTTAGSSVRGSTGSALRRPIVEGSTGFAPRAYDRSSGRDLGTVEQWRKQHPKE